MNCLHCNKELTGRNKKFCSRECLYSSNSSERGCFEKGRINPKKGTGGTKKDWDKKYYEKNKEKVREVNKKWREKNKEKQAEDNRKWAANNVEKTRAIKKAWRERNKATVQSWDAERRALKRKARVDYADKEKIKAFYILAEQLTEKYGEKYTVDHIKPLIKGGLHHEDNLQVITLIDNSRKKDIYPYPVENSYKPEFCN